MSAGRTGNHAGGELTIQYAITVPNAMVDASMQISRPLLWDFEHSACQVGIVAVFKPA